MKNEIFLLDVDSIDINYFKNILNDNFPDFLVNKLSLINAEGVYRSSLGAWTLLSYALYFSNMNYKLKDYNFTKNDYGKYYIENNPVYFNISHSGKYAVVSLSDKNIGCDIELIKKPNLNIARRFFTENETDHILSYNDETLRNKLFFRYWTLKESYVKCIGNGLSIPLDSFSVILEEDSGTLYNIDNIYIKEYLIDDYCICVCSENNDFSERINVVKCEELLQLF